MPRPLSPVLLLAAQRAALLAFAAVTPIAALAQPAAPDPLRADQTTPLTYRSPFDGYRSFRVDELPPWRSVNDVVRSVGGHTGSVRGAEPGTEPTATPQAEIKAPAAPAPKAMPSIPVETQEPSHGRKH